MALSSEAWPRGRQDLTLPTPEAKPGACQATGEQGPWEGQWSLLWEYLWEEEEGHWEGQADVMDGSWCRS